MFDRIDKIFFDLLLSISFCPPDSLHESFESHPQFEVPIGGYLLDLDSQSCDNHMLHEFVDSLRKELKRRESK